MKKQLSILFALIGWFAIITQFILMIQNATAPLTETIIRFFSFFTILTNTIVAVYLTREAFTGRSSKPGTLTSITIYIIIVGLVYQIFLRHTWSPKGLNKLVDELLHSVMPVLVLIYWYLYENKTTIQYKKIPRWLAFPTAYLLYTLIRGSFTGWYPYPFLDVNALGIDRVVIFILVILLIGSLLSAALIFLGKILPRK